MNHSKSTPGYLPSVALRLALVAGATFAVGTVVAQVAGDQLTRTSSAAQGGSSCGAGGCPAMLPCGMPISAFEVRDEVPKCCGLEAPTEFVIPKE